MRGRTVRWLAIAAVACACGVSPRGSYTVEGTVRAVDAPARQVKIDHEDIPGFMPAMTMNFDLADPGLLEGLEPGLRIRFELERDGTRLRLTRWEAIGRGEAGASGALGIEPGEEPAPDFRLVDQDGRELSLSELRGRAVLLDFVFTRCAGPCPILTSRLASLQRRLDPALAARTHFVSVSVDPEYDTPQRLREYASARGADLATWSFLTGEPDAVREVLSAFHVGTIRQPDGSLDHVVVTFLIDPEGRVAARFLGTDHPTDALLAELRGVLS